MARFERGPRREYGEWDELEFDYGRDYGPQGGRRRFRGWRGPFGPRTEYSAERGYGPRIGYEDLGYGDVGYFDEPGYDPDAAYGLPDYEIEAGYGPPAGYGYGELDDFEYGGRAWPYRGRRAPRRYGRPTRRFGPDEFEFGWGEPAYTGYGRRYRSRPAPDFTGWYGGEYFPERREPEWPADPALYGEPEEPGEWGEPRGDVRWGGTARRREMDWPERDVEYGESYRPAGRRGQAMLGVMGGMMDRMEGRPGHTPPDRWPAEGHDVENRPLRELEMDDGEIREAVLENLFQDSWVDPQLIDVGVEDGVVTLSGEVSDFMEARYAWDDAWESAGVRGVVNHLTVRADQPQEEMDMPQTSGQ